jgi:hypothetical protein
LWNRSISTWKAFIHLMLIYEVNNMRNFIFGQSWHLFEKITYELCFLIQFS